MNMGKAMSMYLHVCNFPPSSATTEGSSGQTMGSTSVWRLDGFHQYAVGCGRCLLGLTLRRPPRALGRTLDLEIPPLCCAALRRVRPSRGPSPNITMWRH